MRFRPPARAAGRLTLRRAPRLALVVRGPAARSFDAPGRFRARFRAGTLALCGLRRACRSGARFLRGTLSCCGGQRTGVVPSDRSCAVSSWCERRRRGSRRLRDVPVEQLARGERRRAVTLRRGGEDAVEDGDAVGRAGQIRMQCEREQRAAMRAFGVQHLERASRQRVRARARDGARPRTRRCRSSRSDTDGDHARAGDVEVVRQVVGGSPIAAVLEPGAREHVERLRRLDERGPASRADGVPVATRARRAPRHDGALRRRPSPSCAARRRAASSPSRRRTCAR